MNETLELSTNEPWDTFVAQLLVKVDSVLNLSRIDFDNFNVRYMINRHVPKPGINLRSEDNYKSLLNRLGKLKNPQVTIVVEQNEIEGGEKSVGKENVQPEQIEEAVKSKEAGKKEKKVIYHQYTCIYRLTMVISPEESSHGSSRKCESSSQDIFAPGKVGVQGSPTWLHWRILLCVPQH